MGYSRAGMIDLLKLPRGLLVGLFRSHAAREAEMAFLRQQLLVLSTPESHRKPLTQIAAECADVLHISRRRPMEC
jgi:hypothetical protein